MVFLSVGRGAADMCELLVSLPEVFPRNVFPPSFRVRAVAVVPMYACQTFILSLSLSPRCSSGLLDQERRTPSQTANTNNLPFSDLRFLLRVSKKGRKVSIASKKG